MRVRKIINKRRSQQQAFTLIEIMVVVMIIGMLAAIVGVNVMERFEKAKRKATAAQIRNFMTAMDSYRLDNNHYPSTEQGLKALVQGPADARNFPKGGYLASIPLDPWDHEYVFFCPGLSGEPYTIKSFGADGVDGGEGENADIESSNLDEKQRQQ